MEKGKKISKKFVKWTAFVLIILLLAGGTIWYLYAVGTDASMSTVDNYARPTAVRRTVTEKTEYGFKMTKTDDEPFRILMLTDIHIGAGFLCVRNDRLAIAATAALIEDADPDLVIVTGDIAYPTPFQAGTLNNLLAAQIFAKLMENMNVPWTVTYGNHDTEASATHTREEITAFYANAPGCLLTRGPTDISGCGNQVITLHNKDGSMNVALVQIDSNQYHAGGKKVSKYDIIHDDQLEWYKETILDISATHNGGNLVESLMFFHIPLAEFRTAYELYEDGSDEVEWHFGTLREPVASAGVDCNTFEAVKELGSTTAIFCGHDHVNDFSITYQGVRLTYGKSVDYLAYAWSGIMKKTEQRGSTIIDVKQTGGYEISQRLLTDIELGSTK